MINERLTTTDNLISPPVLDLRLEDADAEGTDEPAVVSGLDFARLFLPGMIFMSVLFITQGISSDLWQEKQGGTLRRAVSAPQSLLLFVGGKLIAGLALIAMVATVALGVGVLVFDLSLLRVPMAVVWCAYAGTALLGLFLFIAILGSTQRTANLISTMTLFR